MASNRRSFSKDDFAHVMYLVSTYETKYVLRSNLSNHYDKYDEHCNHTPSRRIKLIKHIQQSKFIQK